VLGRPGRGQAQRLRYYRPSAQASAGRYRLRGNDRPVSVPAALAGSILGVTGLDNAAPLLPLERAGAAGLTGLHRPRTVRGA